MAEEKTAEKAAYYKWLDLPEDERSPILTEDAYSKSVGVSRQTLIKWKKQRDTGEFDIREAFRAEKKLIWDAFLGAVKTGKINAQLFRTFAQLANELVERKEDTLKLEFTANDRTRIARETINGLRENYQRNGGYCPVCSRPETLCIDAHLDTEPEHTEDREVAAVGIPARPD